MADAATQGGRPPESAVQAGPAPIVRRRRAALRRWADGEPLGEIFAEFRCSRASLFASVPVLAAVADLLDAMLAA
jgi:hypothetical protein